MQLVNMSHTHSVFRIPFNSVENGPGFKAGANDACELEAVDAEASFCVLDLLLSSIILLVHPLLLNKKKIK